MEKKKTCFDFAGGVLCVFGFSTIMMIALTYLFGKSAGEMSSMFRLGNSGISLETLFQYLVLSVLVTGLRYFFFWERLGKHLSELCRTVLMLLGIIAVIVFFIIKFDWFPVNMWQPWILFGLCFAVCFVVSFWIMMVKTKLENEQLAESLEHLKCRWKEEQDDKRS